MTSLAVPVYAPSATLMPGATWPPPTRYLYEAPGVQSDDRRAIHVTFAPGYDEIKRQLIDSTVTAVNRLLQLPPNWDASSAERVAELAAMTAIEWLDRVATGETLGPHVVPLAHGGVQLEWIAGGQAFEIEVGPEGDVGVLGVDAAGNPIVEGEFPALHSGAIIDDARKFLASMFGTPGAAWR